MYKSKALKQETDKPYVNVYVWISRLRDIWTNIYKAPTLDWPVPPRLRVSGAVAQHFSTKPSSD